MPPAEAKVTPGGYLEGITERTTKAEMLKKLQEMAAKLQVKDAENVGRLHEIEERIRAKRGPTNYDLRTVLVTGSAEEYEELINFLEDFEDLLPPMLMRVREGASEALKLNPDDWNG